MVRYVGKANDVSQRYKAHLNRARKHQVHKKNWIEKLKKQGLKPIIEVIDIVPIEDWIFWETYWISQMKTWGFDLINYTNGGDGCTFANQTSFKKGHTSWLGKKHSDETKKKISENNWMKGKVGFNRISVKQLTLDGKLIKIWDSILDAEKGTNSSSSKIVLVCKGKRKTHNNFKWEYNL
jgi:SAM-dependent MidA family methyltransferase